MTNDLIISPESWVSVPGIEGQLVLPEVIAAQGDRATSRYVEFFAKIENENTRTAYLRAAGQFFAWCEVSGLALPTIQPVHVAAYREVLKKHYAAPTIKQHLAAIRRLFDELVVSQVIPHNPAVAVRGPKHSMAKGKTHMPSRDEAKTLLAAIDTTTLVGGR